ncbi:hypothetical protein CFP56_001012 [Quercus suber]|uniref:PGG domain-containing protein n=1 Tax=Quercus suber TaxID=58331 RepID=A0AAW0LGU6_QUESU
MCCSSGEENEFLKEKLSRESALELAKLLVKKDTSWEVTSSGIDTSKLTLHKYGSTSNETNHLQQQVPVGEITPLFRATKSGCIEIVKEILKIFPQAVEHIDNEGRTILHVAIKYRLLEVFDLVLKMELAMRWLRVKSVTKAHFLDHRNKQKQTAEDFKHSLPNKLILGSTFLFLSVSMMMTAFSATIILMIRSKERWTKILLYSISFLPVGIFALAYFPLYLSLSKSYKYLLKKIIKAFPCRCWRLAMSMSNCLQGGN